MSNTNQKYQKILFYSANNQSFENVKQSCGFIKKQSIFYWLKLESIFHQKFNAPDFSHEKIQLPISSKKPFYQLNPLKKILFLHKLKRMDFGKMQFDLIIIGDLGIVEYYLLKLFFTGRIILIQDAILLWSEKYSLKKKLRLLFYQQNRLDLCDKIICSGEATKQTLVQDGVNPKIIYPIGIPRFEKYAKSKTRPNQHNPIPTFLFIGEAYSWHGHNKLDEQQKKILLFLDKIQAHAANKFKIKVRLHPRDKNIYELQHINPIEPTSSSLNDNLLESDYLINYGFPSTVLFEAASMGIKTIFIQSESITYSQMTNFNSFLKLVESVNLDKLEELFENPTSINTNIDTEILNHFVNFNSNSKELLNSIIANKSLETEPTLNQPI